MVILGVDPGCIVAGYAVLSYRHGQVSLLDYGAFKLGAKKPLPKRLSQFHEAFIEKIEQWHITHIVLETPFLGKNAQNFLKLGYVRGILLLLADRYGADIVELSPREIKRALTGYGNASKDQVARVVCRLFPRIGSVERHDISDALAIAIAGLWVNQSCMRGK